MKLKTKNVTFNSVNYNCIVYSSKAAYNVKYNNIVIHSVFQWFLLLFNRVIVSFEIRGNYRLDEISQLLTKHVFNDYYTNVSYARIKMCETNIDPC